MFLVNSSIFVDLCCWSSLKFFSAYARPACVGKHWASEQNYDQVRAQCWYVAASAPPKKSLYTWYHIQHAVSSAENNQYVETHGDWKPWPTTGEHQNFWCYQKILVCTPGPFDHRLPAMLLKKKALQLTNSVARIKSTNVFKMKLVKWHRLQKKKMNEKAAVTY